MPQRADPSQGSHIARAEQLGRLAAYSLTVQTSEDEGTRVTRAQLWHGLVAIFTGFALAFQLFLVVNGAAVLVTTDPPGTAERLIRFFSYFTILSNILVFYTSATLAADPVRDGRMWRVLRLNAMAGIILTGVVHWFFLRPILHLSGSPYIADKLVHVAVPLLAVIGWVAFGPRNRVDASLLPPSLIFPVVWVAYTLIRGASAGWYPYPFVDVGVHGYGVVALNCVGIAALLLVISAALLYSDRWLSRRLDIRSS